ncbi:uncharacterized protein EI97DRAFT_428812 [Westerdykella ornata]|uniref:Uncharacterized protein n=1 Tax=Westerdykella ornata TaxID=318751 RepID=A0A6A6JY79_WESOR|nr:uncharacterized protein EI97DRAFT_428812 [Westerdykella ornata]KAF2280706.1 hypothetical protein EI97DRAFT_428812 [Westerdykella ornata]
MDFAGISEEEQYLSTLPADTAVPATFPSWAYAEELRESQKKILKAREEANARNPRDSITFVPAAKSGSAASSKSATPSGKEVGRESGAERIMAGLTAQGQKRKELERRGGREESLSSQRNRSRSPKRRREGYRR